MTTRGPALAILAVVLAGAVSTAWAQDQVVARVRVENPTDQAMTGVIVRGALTGLLALPTSRTSIASVVQDRAAASRSGLFCIPPAQPARCRNIG